MATSESRRMKLTVPLGTTGATLSVGVKSSRSSFYGQASIRSVREVETHALAVTLDPTNIVQESTLNSYFAWYVDNGLPEYYDKHAYSKFLQLFGTHIVTECILGGETSLWVDVDMSYYSEGTSNSMDLNIIDQTTKLYADFTTGSDTSSQEFNAAASAELRVVGGDADSIILTNNGNSEQRVSNYNEWAKSVAENPVPVEVTLKEISDFVSDEKKSQNIHRAILDYASYYAVASEVISGLAIVPSEPQV